MSELTSRELWLLMNSNAYFLLHKEDISAEVWNERMDLDKKVTSLYNKAKRREEMERGL